VPDTSPASNNPAQYSLAGTGSINARIDPLITTALLRASVERRISRQTPSTQRDIIAEALSDWLKKLGYITYTKTSNNLDRQSEWNSPDSDWKWY